MGIIAETFRKFSDVHQSAHPQASIGAWGKNAGYIVESHPVDDVCREKSPLAKLYELDAKNMKELVDYGVKWLRKNRHYEKMGSIQD
jgi:aminoglycoside 3-N-acetyltransferase